MPQAPWKIRISADGAGTLAAVHATVELVNRALGFPKPWAWYRGDDIQGLSDGDSIVDWPDRGQDDKPLRSGFGVDAVYESDTMLGHPGIMRPLDSGGSNADEVFIELYDDYDYNRTAQGGWTMVLAATGAAATGEAVEFQLFADTALSAIVKGVTVFSGSGNDAVEVSTQVDLWHANGVQSGGPTVMVVRATTGGVVDVWVNGTQVASAATLTDVPTYADGKRVFIGTYRDNAATAPVNRQGTTEQIAFDLPIDPDATLIDFAGTVDTLHGYLAGRYPSLFT